MSSDGWAGHPARHDRVWLDATRLEDHLRPLEDAVALDAVCAWVRQGRALVARRRDASAGPDDLHLAIALPLAEGRRRIALVVDRRAVQRIAPPLPLAEVVATAPHDRRHALRVLCDRATAIATPLAVYGSFAWQAISGEACVTPASDIDLLWAVRDEAQAARMLDLLTRWEHDTGLAADGEARFIDGDSVAWRELIGGSARVLVKRDDGVALRPAPWRHGRSDSEVGSASDQREDPRVVERAVKA